MACGSQGNQDLASCMPMACQWPPEDALFGLEQPPREKQRVYETALAAGRLVVVL